MGRHAIMSSSLRSPAVLVGVPVATVLATLGGNAVLGGVVPSAEEAPLRAESVDAAPVTAPGPVPASPVIVTDALGYDLLTPDGGAPAARARDAGPDALEDLDTTTDATTDATTGAAPRVVRVADKPVRPTVDRRAERVRVVDTVRERTDARPVATSADTPGTRSTASPSPAPETPPRAVGAPRLAAPASSSAAATTPPAITPVATTSDDSAAEDDGADVVDLDTPAGGLSLLSFG